MFDWLLNKNGLDIINCIFQGIIAGAAVFAICITIKQVSGRAKVNLKIRPEFRLNKMKEEPFFVELGLRIVNLGMAPIFVSSCGIQLWEYRKEKRTIRISDKSFVLQPGTSTIVYGEYDFDMINDIASLHDKVHIYAVCQMDKIYYDKKKYSYGEFKFECEKINKLVEKEKQRTEKILTEEGEQQ